ncbi:MAG: ribonuclease H family protein, partial [Bacteroidota bacterium]
KSVREVLKNVNVEDFLDKGHYRRAELPPWNYPSINISFSNSLFRKGDLPQAALQQDFYGRLSALPCDANILYSDGSLQEDGRAGAGVALYTNGIYQSSKSLCIRTSNYCSTTQTELLGIAAALTVAKNEMGNVTIVSDSLSALQSIEFKTNDLCNRIIKLIYIIQSRDRHVSFIWAPSHCNIIGNDKADELAKQGSNKESIDYEFPLSIQRLKTKIGKIQSDYYEECLNSLYFESESVKTYFDITNGTKPNYEINNLFTRKFQTSFSRLRLGYRYLWEVSGDLNPNVRQCRLCGLQDSHTLYHYIKECSMLSGY